MGLSGDQILDFRADAKILKKILALYSVNQLKQEQKEIDSKYFLLQNLKWIGLCIVKVQ